jgi:hypothetical protein
VHQPDDEGGISLPPVGVPLKPLEYWPQQMYVAPPNDLYMEQINS